MGEALSSPVTLKWDLIVLFKSLHTSHHLFVLSLSSVLYVNYVGNWNMACKMLSNPRRWIYTTPTENFAGWSALWILLSRIFDSLACSRKLNRESRWVILKLIISNKISILGSCIFPRPFPHFSSSGTI